MPYTTTSNGFHKLSHLHDSYDCQLMTHEPDTNTGKPDIYSPFDSEDDRCQGCQNVSHFHQQSFSRLH